MTLYEKKKRSLFVTLNPRPPCKSSYFACCVCQKKLQICVVLACPNKAALQPQMFEVLYVQMFIGDSVQRAYSLIQNKLAHSGGIFEGMFYLINFLTPE